MASVFLREEEEVSRVVFVFIFGGVSRKGTRGYSGAGVGRELGGEVLFGIVFYGILVLDF